VNVFKSVELPCVRRLNETLFFNCYFNARVVNLVLFLFQPTNAQIYITTVSVYIMYTRTCFDMSVLFSGSFTCVPRQVIEILEITAAKITVPCNY
jgi:hypothetical protein